MNLAKTLLNAHSPGKRYAYYPATSLWGDWKGELEPVKGDTALYLHIPFCKELCTFCGCNIRISQKKEEHTAYVQAIIKEWEILRNSKSHRELIELWQSKPLSRLILGGGTPSSLHPEARDLLGHFLKSTFSSIESGLVESAPKSFTKDFAQWSKDIGIDTFSFGVQDFHEEILINVNRHQSIEDIEKALSYLDDLDTKGIDLIWGLPKQTPQTIESWKGNLNKLRLDWISYYPLASVPWLSPYQNAYGDFTLPTLEEKYWLYESGNEIFKSLDYEHYSFGHFIHKEGKLYSHLNETGLDHKVSGLFPLSKNKDDFNILGLGVGAISELNGQYTQNEKILDKYLLRVNSREEIPLNKYHLQTNKERTFLSSVKNLLNGQSLRSQFEDQALHFTENQLQTWFNDQGTLNEQGRHQVKNVLQSIEKAYFGS